MNSGQLRHNATIRQPRYDRDGNGQTVTCWPVFRRCRARLTPLAGTESLVAGQVQSSITHNLLIRHVDGLSENMIVVIDGRVFQIGEIRPDPTLARHQWLKLAERTNPKPKPGEICRVFRESCTFSLDGFIDCVIVRVNAPAVINYGSGESIEIDADSPREISIFEAGTEILITFNTRAADNRATITGGLIHD
jgi:SPP1 family predicted phage head-tail adaptor